MGARGEVDEGRGMGGGEGRRWRDGRGGGLGEGVMIVLYVRRGNEKFLGT